MVRCCQATSHYLSQCWPSSLMSYGVTCHSFNWLYSLHRQAISGYAIDFVSSTIRVFLKKHFPDLCCCSLEESYEIWARKSSFVCLYTTEGWNPMNLRVNCLQPKYPLTGSATMTLTQYEHQASQISRTRLFVQQKIPNVTLKPLVTDPLYQERFLAMTSCRPELGLMKSIPIILLDWIIFVLHTFIHSMRTIESPSYGSQHVSLWSNAIVNQLFHARFHISNCLNWGKSGLSLHWICLFKPASNDVA